VDHLPKAYRVATPPVRRRYNQAFLKAVYVKDRQIAGVEIKEPFDTLLSSKGSNSELSEFGTRVSNWLR
jgi:hypothetical protein